MDDLEKKLWLIDREIKSQGRKLDILLKELTTLQKDIKDFLSVEKTYRELVNSDEPKK